MKKPQNILLSACDFRTKASNDMSVKDFFRSIPQPPNSNRIFSPLSFQINISSTSTLTLNDQINTIVNRNQPQMFWYYLNDVSEKNPCFFVYFACFSFQLVWVNRKTPRVVINGIGKLVCGIPSVDTWQQKKHHAPMSLRFSCFHLTMQKKYLKNWITNRLCYVKKS